MPYKGRHKRGPGSAGGNAVAAQPDVEQGAVFALDDTRTAA